MEFTKKDLNKTLRVKQEDQIKNRKRFRVDANGKTLGRLAVDIANKLSGKGNTYYSDFWDGGDFVLVENVDKISVTGKKLEEKVYYSYSGYKGNVKEITLKNLLIKNPSKALWFAVRGMLAKNKLRDSRMKRLKMVVGTTTKYDNFKPLNLYK
ncbi:50S ribosomal protein L13 [Candidatus Gracilibacteria bacterium]|nr:50S ribosomal protein L13 [Candidatus Gracilibacteria bacterium]